MDEIPTALREIELQPKSTNAPANLIVILLSTIAFLSIFVIFLSRSPNQIQATSNSPTQPIVSNNQSNNQNTESNNLTAVENSNNSTTDPENQQNSTTTVSIPENILGHLPYKEASIDELESISSDGRIRLRIKAAEKFKAMQADARNSGIILTPISGFRSVAEQEHLFFDVKEQRQQVASKRAEVSAPPGYSEHHTGYAVDIGDSYMPATNLNHNFDQTPAYKWLVKNAAKYSFEMSFSTDNLQGISYEPWHWRYIGDTDSLETFYKARNLTTQLNQNN